MERMNASRIAAAKEGRGLDGGGGGGGGAAYASQKCNIRN